MVPITTTEQGERRRPEQYAGLRALGCEYAQGYLFSRPVYPGDLKQALEKCQAVLSEQPKEPPVPAPRELPTTAAAVLGRVSELLSEGASLHTIAAALNREHPDGPGEVRWHSTSVARLVATLARPAREPG